MKQDSTSQFFEIYPSCCLKKLILFAYALAIIAIVQLPQLIGIRILLVVILLFSLVYQFKQIMQPKFIGVQMQAQVLFLIKRDGQALTFTQTGAALVMPYLVILRGTTADGARQSLLLMADSMEKQAFRRFRVLLRWGSSVH